MKQVSHRSKKKIILIQNIIHICNRNQISLNKIWDGVKNKNTKSSKSNKSNKSNKNPSTSEIVVIPNQNKTVNAEYLPKGNNVVISNITIFHNYIYFR